MKVVWNSSVKDEWIDYNGHVNDAEYAKVFSMAICEWLNEVN